MSDEEKNPFKKLDDENSIDDEMLEETKLGIQQDLGNYRKLGSGFQFLFARLLEVIASILGKKK